MQPHDLVIGLAVGGVAILFGLTPGLFDALTERVQTFRDAVLFGARPRRHTEAGRFQRPLWLAVAGALTILAYVWN